MAPAELVFERFAYALEAVKGTAIGAPTHNFYMLGQFDPATSYYEPGPTSGIRSMRNRQLLTRTHNTLALEGGYDHRGTANLLACLVGAPSLTTPVTGAVYTRTYTPNQFADDLKSLTGWWGDPNTQIWQSKYIMLNEMTITTDASTEDGTTISVSGFGQFPTAVAAPAFPVTVVGAQLIPAYMRLWMGNASYTITEITGRLISATTTIRNGVVAKWLAAGGPAPVSGAALSFSKHGMGRTECETRITMELADTAQYDQFVAGTPMRMQVARFGNFLASDAGTDYYDVLRVLSYGPLRDLEWGDLEGTNRTVSFTQLSAYDSTLLADFQVQHTSGYGTV